MTEILDRVVEKLFSFFGKRDRAEFEGAGYWLFVIGGFIVVMAVVMLMMLLFV